MPASTLVDSQLGAAMGHKVDTFRRGRVMVEMEKGTQQGGWEAAKRKGCPSILPFSQTRMSHLDLNHPKTKDDGTENHGFQLLVLHINCSQLSTKFNFKSPRKASVSPHPQPQPFPDRGPTLHHHNHPKRQLSPGRVANDTSVRNLNLCR